MRDRGGRGESGSWEERDRVESASWEEKDRENEKRESVSDIVKG